MRLSQNIYGADKPISASSVSDTDLILKPSNRMLAFHDSLLYYWLVSLDFHNLFLHVVIFFLLLHDTCLQILEVSHNMRIDNFDIFVILGR